MAARRDGDDVPEVDLGLAVMVMDGDGRVAAQDIQLSDGLRGLADAGGFGGHMLPQLDKQVVFQGHDPILGRQDGALQLL